MSSPRRLRLALIGLGRLGSIRAKILVSQQPRVELVAVCDTKPGAEEWAVANLPPSVRFYPQPEEMMRSSGAEAVLISTATATHAPLIIQALENELHVMCEKPISIDVITTEEVLVAAAAKPHLKFLVPFSRRYDESYRAAKQLVQSGSLGEIHAVETSCLDQQDPTGFFVAFSAQSGGIFVDMGVHDIDIARYFLDVSSELKNPKKQVNRVFALGQQAVYSDLAKHGDCDNGWALVEFANGKGMTRIFGTKGTSIINGDSALNRVEVRDQYGVRKTTTPDAFVLYGNSFINDIAEFAGAVLDNTPLSCYPEDAYEAAKIATALQCSFRNQVAVLFDDNGLPIIPASTANGL